MRALAVVSVVVLGLPTAAGAAPTASEVLAGIDAAYASVQRAKLDFAQTTTSAVFGDQRTSGGVIYIARPLLRWEYRTARKGATTVTKVFVASATKIVAIDHLNKQYMVQPIKSSEMPVALGFLTGAGRLAEEFTATLGAAKAGTIAVALTPRAPSAAYARIELVVDATTYQVTSSTVVDSAGNTNGFVFSHVDLGAEIDARVFKVNPKALKHYRKVAFAAGAGSAGAVGAGSAGAVGAGSGSGSARGSGTGGR